VLYEARTLLGLGVSRCRTCVVSDTDTCNYTELCNFFKLLAVSACQCPVSVSVLHSMCLILHFFFLELQQVGNSLSKVEQSPSKSMLKALSPSLKALISDKLIKHSDVGVKVALASCLSELTRITAPDGPYNDHQMKVCLIFYCCKLIELNYILLSCY